MRRRACHEALILKPLGCTQVSEASVIASHRASRDARPHGRVTAKESGAIGPAAAGSPRRMPSDGVLRRPVAPRDDIGDQGRRSRCPTIMATTLTTMTIMATRTSMRRRASARPSRSGSPSTSASSSSKRSTGSSAIPWRCWPTPGTISAMSLVLPSRGSQACSRGARRPPASPTACAVRRSSPRCSTPSFCW